ncbi:MAG: hypothetical protein M1536_06510 [Firmicutes bacterium]|nr:hypothetical protein [Bacillota bacterium]
MKEKLAPKRARYDRVNNQDGCSFKLEHYREILSAAIKKGYHITSFAKYDSKKKKSIILRHDIDGKTDVEKALEFSSIEREIGASATYFLRVHSAEYNPYEYRCYEIFTDILAMGHEIGLHFEAVDMEPVSGEDSKIVFLKEKLMLENIYGIKIISASQHGDYSFYSHPGYYYFFDRVKKGEVGIKNHTFEPGFYNEIKYLSDSNSVWLEGCPCRHLGKHDKFQILTHPKWWFREFYHTW